MVKRIEFRYSLTCECEGAFIVPESLRGGRQKLTEDLLQDYMDLELLKELIVGGEIEAELQDEMMELVVTFWSPHSLNDHVRSRLTDFVSIHLQDGMGESGFVVQDGGREYFYEATESEATRISELDDERAPYPAPHIAMAAYSGDEGALQTAIAKHPESIDAPALEGRTALHHSLGHPARIRMLLDAGANPNVMDVLNLTPLNLLLFIGPDLSDAENLAVAQMLVDAGADTSIVDYKGET